jgi:hypothetical protein
MRRYWIDLGAGPVRRPVRHTLSAATAASLTAAGPGTPGPCLTTSDGGDEADEGGGALPGAAAGGRGGMYVTGSCDD